MSQSQIKPWHIIVFTLAVILVMWQAFAYMKQRQAQKTEWRGERITAPTTTPYTPPQFQRIRERMEQEK